MTKPLHVEILDEPIEPGRNFTDKTTGMQKLLPGKQKAYLWNGTAAYPVPFKLEVDPAQGPFRPGLYMIAGECFGPGEYDRLKFDNRKFQLIPMDLAIGALSGVKPKVAAVG